MATRQSATTRDQGLAFHRRFRGTPPFKLIPLSLPSVDRSRGRSLLKNHWIGEDQFDRRFRHFPGQAVR